MFNEFILTRNVENTTRKKDDMNAIRISLLGNSLVADFEPTFQIPCVLSPRKCIRYIRNKQYVVENKCLAKMCIDGSLMWP